MITDRSVLLPYLGKEVLAVASFTNQRRREAPQPPLYMILHVRLRKTNIYVNHLWVTLPRDTVVVPGQRFCFRGVVVRYLRGSDMSDSCTISRIELVRDNDHV